MNVRLDYQCQFLAGVYWNNEVILNSYAVSCEMITGTSDNVEQNIALQRLKYMLFEQMQNSIFVSNKEKAVIKKLEAAGVKTVALPELPVDQIIGMMLYSKLNAVMEDRIIISELKLSSELGDSVWYKHSEMESIGPFAEEGWWNNSERMCTDSKSSSSKVVSITNNAGWKTLDLDWPDDESGDSDDSTVVVFKKDE